MATQFPLQGFIANTALEEGPCVRWDRTLPAV